jgi:GntR family transcriptional regulator, arabinose operon transcriptional repressor
MTGLADQLDSGSGSRAPAAGRNPDREAVESAQPAHRRIYSLLEERIASGAWPVGTRLPAEPEIAAQLGVSRGTLRRALARLRERGLVDGAPGRGSFVRSTSPSAPQGLPRIVGVLVPSVARPSAGTLLTAIEDELDGLGYSMLVATSGTTPAQESGRAGRMVRTGIAGLICYPLDHGMDARLYRSLLDDRVPLVLVDRYVVGLGTDAVLSDNLGGAFQATSHLAGLGHRRIAFVTTDNLTTTSVAERQEGYRMALAEHGIPYGTELVSASLGVHAFSSPTSPVEVVSRFLEAARPTAVFALHDRVAYLVHRAATALGLRVPQDLSLVGFDDDAAIHEALPFLTSVEQPREPIGRTAARMLVDQVEGRRREHARYVLPTRLVIRASTAAPALATVASRG